MIPAEPSKPVMILCVRLLYFFIDEVTVEVAMVYGAQNTYKNNREARKSPQQQTVQRWRGPIEVFLYQIRTSLFDKDRVPGEILRCLQNVQILPMRDFQTNNTDSRIVHLKKVVERTQKTESELH
jgi:hypothetical protein